MSDTPQQDLETRIRERAYALWQEEGCPEGRAEEFWLRARQLIETEGDGKAPDMTKDPPL